tara:strand:- start:1416 stop:1667 length:252 start_codon:yes stop_codon:yes gene_type:complete
MMRTTLSIEDDIAEGIEDLRARENLSLREVVNRLLREGLTSMHRETTVAPYEGRVFETALQPGIDPNRMNQLADELEIEDFVS